MDLSIRCRIFELAKEGPTALDVAVNERHLLQKQPTSPNPQGLYSFLRLSWLVDFVACKHEFLARHLFWE